MTFPFPYFIPPTAGASSGWGGPTSGLIHRWPMDNANVSGTTIYDVAGSLNGSATTGVTSTTGPQGTDTASAFNGSAYVAITSQPVPGAPFSLFTWAKLNSTPSTSPSVISFSTNSSNQYFISNEGAHLAVCAGNPSSGTKAVYTASSSPFSSPTWHHVGFTWDGTTLTVYIDGFAVSALSDVGWPSATNDFRFGNMKGGTDYLNGALKQVVVYNRVLSSADVSKLYAAY